MMSIENRVGRLIETRIAWPVAFDEIDRFEHERVRIVQRMSGHRIVCMDMRGLHVLPPDTADRITAMLRASTPGLSRNGVLVAAGRATLALQLERVIREAGNPARRLFTSRDELITWLGEVTTAVEKARLESFLAEVPEAR